MSSRRGSTHPKPWMEDSIKVTAGDLERIISDDGIVMLPSRAMDEVYPGIYIGEHGAAANVLALKIMKFTHVLNVALGKGQFHCNTNRLMYTKVGIKFMGVKAEDTPMYNLLPHFAKTSDYIHKAVSKPGGKILVHCKVGASRSAAVVLAYLMLKESKSVTEATQIIRDKREISPNSGFLRQLCILQERIDSNDIADHQQRCTVS